MATSRDVLAALAIRIGIDSSSMGKQLNQVKSRLNPFTSVVRTLGATMAATFSVYALKNFFQTSLEGYDKQAKAIAKINQALKTTQGAAQRSSAELQKNARVLQDNTLFGDETILNDVTAQLLTFTNISGDAFDRATELALDLATVIGTDLRSQTIQLGKALNDPLIGLTGLRRVGISFTTAQTELIKKLTEENKLFEAQKLILDELDRQYGGQARAAANSGLGAVTQAVNAFGDMKETLGAMAAPTVTKSAKLWQEWATIMASADLSKWDKLLATFSNSAKHNLYEEMGFKDLFEAPKSEEFQRLEKFFGIVGGTTRNENGEYLYKRTTGTFGEEPPVTKIIPKLEKLNAELETYKDNFSLGNTDAEFIYWDNLINKTQQEIDRINELGKVTREIAAQRAANADFLGGITPMASMGVGGVQLGDEFKDMPLSVDFWKNHQMEVESFYDEWQNTASKIQAINDTLIYSFTDLAAQMAYSLGEMVVTGKFNSNALLGTMAGMAENLGKLVMEMGITELAAMEALKSLNPYVAIAAGATLIALAGAMRAGMQDIGSGGSASINMPSYGTYNDTITRNFGEADKEITVYVEGVISGEDIRLVNERASKKHAMGY